MIDECAEARILWLLCGKDRILLSLYYPRGEIPCRQPPQGGAQHVFDVSEETWSNQRKPKHRENMQTPLRKALPEPGVEPWTF